MEDGRLTDGQGRTVDFTNAVLIMTSNVGSQFIDADLTEEVIKARVMTAVESTFKPEFINRIDEIVVFHRLTREELAEIVSIQLGQLRARLADRGIGIAISEAAAEHLADADSTPHLERDHSRG